MGLYRLHFHATTDQSPSVRDGEYANDGAAAEAAFRELREHGESIAVELWEGARLVTRIERPSDAFLSSRSGLHGLD
ncbi:MAG: hypothetical protein EON88_02820 [Brevundimonas sp.]|nr:MAG: hypothetical protein EON88_02820 [Brevundimonas sp.]